MTVEDIQQVKAALIGLVRTHGEACNHDMFCTAVKDGNDAIAILDRENPQPYRPRCKGKCGDVECEEAEAAWQAQRDPACICLGDGLMGMACPVHPGAQPEAEMTDQEVIATFMEPRPQIEGGYVPGSEDRWNRRWWKWYTDGKNHLPRDLTLDALHEVEARLTYEQWAQYSHAADAHGWGRGGGPWYEFFKRLTHASAEQKIHALANVLRATAEVVKRAEDAATGRKE